MSEICIIYRKVPGKPDDLQVLNNGSGWALAHTGETAGQNGHVDVRLFYTQKELTQALRQAGANFKGSNVPKSMTLEEYVGQTTPPKKDDRKQEDKKK